MNIGTRSQVKDLLKKGLVTVNGRIVKKGDEKVDEKKDRIICQGKEYTYRPFYYYIMKKTTRVVNPNKHQNDPTVIELFFSKIKNTSLRH